MSTVKPLSSSPLAVNVKSVSVPKPLPLAASLFAAVSPFLVWNEEAISPDIVYSTALADTIARDPANAERPIFLKLFIIFPFVMFFI